MPLNWFESEMAGFVSSREKSGAKQCFGYLRFLLRAFVRSKWDEYRGIGEGQQVVGTFRFDYEFENEYNYDFSNLVCVV